MKTKKIKNPWYMSHKHKEGWTIVSGSFPTLKAALKDVKKCLHKSVGPGELVRLACGERVRLYDGAENISVRNKTPGFYKNRTKSFFDKLEKEAKL